MHGGRVYQTQTATVAPVREGIILPPSRPVNDAAGRIIIFVIDDLHLEFRDTHRVRRLFRDMAKELVHDGDLFGIVSTGTSSIAIDLTYDRTRMEEAANRITGGGLKPSEIIQQSSTGETPQEVMHRANVAFETVYDMLNNLQQTQHRRKAVVLISNGYDFDPFASSRAGTADSVFLNNRNVDPNDPYNSRMNQGNQFNDAELSMRLAELTRQANRANATFYTFDPRGLVAGRRYRRAGGSGRVGTASPEIAGQPARACGVDGWDRRRQYERSHESAQADRCRDERLLRAGLLLVQPRPDAAPPA